MSATTAASVIASRRTATGPRLFWATAEVRRRASEGEPEPAAR
jgi:hypothetical protein